MNPMAILALIGDLYSQISQLQQENAELRKRVEVQEQATKAESEVRSK